MAPPPTHTAQFSAEDAVAGGEALWRPAVSWRTKLVTRMLANRPVHEIQGADVDRWLASSIAALALAGADDAPLERLRSHRAEWEISTEPCPPEIWCGEVLWPTREGGEPHVVLYPNSPWGRMPAGPIFEVASLTAIDHMASHLYHYFAGGDFSEEAACADEVRLMWGRPGLLHKAAALAIFAGTRWHKQIPVSDIASRLRRSL